VRSSPRRRGARHRTRARGRGRPVLGWIVVIAVLVAAAVLAGRTLRSSLPGRAPTAGPVGADVQVYFVRSEAGGRAQTLAMVHRHVPAGGTQASANAALQRLLQGPSRAEHARGLTSEIPPGTVLRAVTIANGTATVDLGVAFAQGGGSASMLGRVWQVVYTATQFPDVTAVQLLIGGRRVDTLGGEGVMVGTPLRRPASPPTF
jgi:spore germination protein GerM